MWKCAITNYCEKQSNIKRFEHWSIHPLLKTYDDELFNDKNVNFYISNLAFITYNLIYIIWYSRITSNILPLHNY